MVTFIIIGSIIAIVYAVTRPSGITTTANQRQAQDITFTTTEQKADKITMAGLPDTDREHHIKESKQATNSTSKLQGDRKAQSNMKRKGKALEDKEEQLRNREQMIDLKEVANDVALKQVQFKEEMVKKMAEHEKREMKLEHEKKVFAIKQLMDAHGFNVREKEIKLLAKENNINFTKKEIKLLIENANSKDYFSLNRKDKLKAIDQWIEKWDEE